MEIKIRLDEVLVRTEVGGKRRAKEIGKGGWRCWGKGKGKGCRGKGKGKDKG